MKLKPYVLAIAGAALLAPMSGMAGLVTVEFDELSQGLYPSNLVSKGMRFSPKCHYDVRTSYEDIRPGYTGHTAIGWDFAGCDSQNNADYLGPAAGNGPMYIDMSGSHFSLSSIDVIFQDFALGGTWTSSKGGTFTIQNDQFSIGALQHIDIKAPEWTDIEWMVATNGGGGPNYWLDAIALQVVPEPTTAALVAIAAFGALLHRRRSHDAC